MTNPVYEKLSKYTFQKTVDDGFNPPMIDTYSLDGIDDKIAEYEKNRDDFIAYCNGNIARLQADRAEGEELGVVSLRDNPDTGEPDPNEPQTQPEP